jgi:hypothetical protein
VTERRRKEGKEKAKREGNSSKGRRGGRRRGVDGLVSAFGPRASSAADFLFSHASASF